MGKRPPGPSPSNKHKLVHTPACPTHTTNNTHLPRAHSQLTPLITPPRAFTVDTTLLLCHATPTLITGTFLPSSFSTTLVLHANTIASVSSFLSIQTSLPWRNTQLRKLPKPRTKVFCFWCSSGVLLSDPSLCSRTLSAACGSNPWGGYLHLQKSALLRVHLFCLVCFALVPTRGPRRLAT